MCPHIYGHATTGSSAAYASAEEPEHKRSRDQHDASNVIEVGMQPRWNKTNTFHCKSFHDNLANLASIDCTARYTGRTPRQIIRKQQVTFSVTIAKGCTTP